MTNALDLKGLHELADRVKASGGFMDMGLGTRQAKVAELGERSARENFALYSTFPGSGKREMLLEGVPHGSRIVVICPKVMEKLWAEHIERKVDATVEVWGREYAAQNSTKVARAVAGGCDYLIIEDPKGLKSCQRLARITAKAPRAVVIGFSTGERLQRDLQNAATVLNVAPKALPVVLIAGGSTTRGGTTK